MHGSFGIVVELDYSFFYSKKKNTKEMIKDATLTHTLQT